MSHIELILGGARSGKSSLAEQRALAWHAENGGKLVYIATAQAGDGEMRERISMHQQQRDSRWQLAEAPLRLDLALQQYNQPDCTVLVDCLTLWLTNWLCQQGLEAWRDQRERVLATIEAFSGRLLLVSNEVGHGIVPMGELSRHFVDESGWLHQAIAKQAHRVDFVMAGLPLTLKAADPQGQQL